MPRVIPEGPAILMVPIMTTATHTDEDVSITDARVRWQRFGQGDQVRAPRTSHQVC